MNKDLQLFTNVINFLVYHTTNDEYGISRSQGIETYGHLAEDLNISGIIPKRGYWTEQSLKSFLRRIEKRYPENVRYDQCNVEFIGRSSWEYQSYSLKEEVCSVRSKKIRTDLYDKNYKNISISQIRLFSDFDYMDEENSDSN